MADLTNMESKLGEVMGLAMAAQAATAKVQKLAENDAGLVNKLEQMHAEASETEKRCARIADGIDGKKTAIHEEAKQTKSKGAEMMKIYLDADSDALDGFEFLTMAEAGEVGHWKVLRQMSRSASNSDVFELCGWAIPIQERHFSVVTDSSEQLAAAEDPVAVA